MSSADDLRHRLGMCTRQIADKSFASDIRTETQRARWFTTMLGRPAFATSYPAFTGTQNAKPVLSSGRAESMKKGTSNRAANDRRGETISSGGGSVAESKPKGRLPRGIHASNGRYRVRVTAQARYWSCGTWGTVEEAIAAHDRAVLYFGIDPSHLLRADSAKRLKPASPALLSRECVVQEQVRNGRYLGVKRFGTRFVAHFSHEDRNIHCGVWSTAEEAAVARDRAMLYLRIEAPLQEPALSKRLGPASPAEPELSPQMRPKISRKKGCSLTISS